jgi:hypothetical protein
MVLELCRFVTTPPADMTDVTPEARDPPPDTIIPTAWRT